MDAPLLSINIVSYNTKNVTLDCLNSISRCINKNWLTDKPSDDIEIVIVDNNSQDGTQEEVLKLQKSYPINIKLIRNKENLGFGKGHNRAAKESSGELLFLLNTDTILMNDALSKLTSQYLQYNPSNSSRFRSMIKDLASGGERVHFLGPKLLNSDLTPQPSCGPYYSIPIIMGALFMRGDHWGLTRMSPSYRKQVDWVSGACMLCKKEYFDELGGFDENIFMYMEEIDLLYRARKKGMTVWFTPDVHVVHLGSASSNKQYPIYQVYRGFIYLYKKHHSSLEYNMVQSILRLKSYVAMAVGNLLHRQDVVETYRNALQIVNEYESPNTNR